MGMGTASVVLFSNCLPLCLLWFGGLGLFIYVFIFNFLLPAIRIFMSVFCYIRNVSSILHMKK